MLALNLLWSCVDVLVLRAIARGTRLRASVALGAAASLAAFVVATYPSPLQPHLFRAMRAASFAIFLHVPLLALGVAWIHRQDLRRGVASLAVAIPIALVGADAFLYEPHALVTSTYELTAPARLRVAVLSDFQATHIGDYEREVLARLAALDPQLLLLAGDYIQVYGAERAATVADFRRAWQDAGFHPPLGTYAVRGDVEPDGWESEIFGGLGVVTSNETRTFDVKGVALTLLSLQDSTNRNLALPPSSAFERIALGHRPDFALGSGPAGLLVAGHTHGGQVQVPFLGPPLILSAVPRAWGGGGLHVVEPGRALLVTRGAGVEHADDAPPLRFNCRPEIVLLQMSPSRETGREGPQGRPR